MRYAAAGQDAGGGHVNGMLLTSMGNSLFL
jgi:hypothetical protein